MHCQKKKPIEKKQGLHLHLFSLLDSPPKSTNLRLKPQIRLHFLARKKHTVFCRWHPGWTMNQQTPPGKLAFGTQSHVGILERWGRMGKSPKKWRWEITLWKINREPKVMEVDGFGGWFSFFHWVSFRFAADHFPGLVYSNIWLW